MGERILLVGFLKFKLFIFWNWQICDSPQQAVDREKGKKGKKKSGKKKKKKKSGKKGKKGKKEKDLTPDR